MMRYATTAVLAASMVLVGACKTEGADAPPPGPDRDVVASPDPTDGDGDGSSDDSDDSTVSVDVDATDPTLDVAGDGDTTSTPVAGDLALTGGIIAGFGARTIIFKDGKIAAVLSPQAPVMATVIDISGRWVAPSFIDSHVHALYRPATSALAAGGLGAVVDHAAPTAIFTTDFKVDDGPAALTVLAAGPMVTPLKGYPTQSWGANGYGIECADLAAAKTAIDGLKAQGAALVKVPIGAGADFDAATLKGIVDHAHLKGMKVSTHATSVASAVAAASAGCDILAHTPTQALSDAAVTAWSSRHVISTLKAFGGSAATLDNLTRLRAAGAVILYGTDYGNTTHTGIDPTEIELLKSAGLTGSDIVAAGTSAPAAFWGLSGFGQVAAGYVANLLVLDADPMLDPGTLARPIAVYLSGHDVSAKPARAPPGRTP